ncbi:MAG TPA: M28 family peptidase [Chitinophaga sp.]|uniref:M28 family peptidase n=1 Tax=Chitinophaga sp. TaxID=1869181 RepID=UPI002C54850C|nr:M28 family peptidase [Chitinophaga sp.]HVI46313.1 M28 family peptidase [Chitinophaga sp.]
MKKTTWLLPLVFTTMIADAQKKTDRKTLNNLQQHITYLSSDKLEGRRTGGAGEQLAAAYISTQLQQIGVAPQGDDGFKQVFIVKEGREPAENCTMSLNHTQLHVGAQFIPLPFSAAKSAKGEVLPNANEPDNIWLININELDTDKRKSRLEQYQQQTQIAAKSGATGIIFFNGKETPAEVSQWLEHNPPAATIPAVWVNGDISKKLSDDEANAFLIDMQVSLKKVKRTGTNVIGYIDNKAPRTIIIGAHYDHLGLGEDEQIKDKTIFHGADDNASGVAALLELARILKASRLHNQNYIIAAFSGKEQGLCGSKYFASHNNIDPAQVNYMINMDMIGRLDPGRGLQIGGIGTSPGWPSIITTASKGTRVVLDSSGTGPSDHTSFYKKNIPVLYFYTGAHSDYHQPGDVADKINYDGTLSIVKMIYDIIDQTNNMEKLAFTPTRELQATARK